MDTPTLTPNARKMVRVKTYREKHGCSLNEAGRAITQEDMLIELKNATTVEDLKPLIQRLICGR
jgi:hypothetical protein